MNRTSPLLITAIAALAFLAAPGDGRAAEPDQPAEATPATTSAQPMMCPLCRRLAHENVSYGDKTSRTLARGALNAALGWTELIRQPAKEAREGGNPMVGIANGVGRSVSRTFSGFAEMFTFWAPKNQGTYFHFIENCPLDATD